MIPLMKNSFLGEQATKAALADFIASSTRLSMGEQCFTFEKAFAAKEARKHAVLFNSGASANLALLQALKNLGLLKDNDEVGFSALTWATNVMPIIQLNMRAIPIDCSSTTLNMMSSQLATRLATNDLKAVFITNALGLVGDLAQIRELCRSKNIILLEDNCEALGTELAEGRAGSFGLASTFSFFVGHHMSTIEGGMVCTDDEALASMLKIVRSNGWDRNLSAIEQADLRKQHGISSEFLAKYTFYELGFNLRPTEITGFLGSEQLKYLDETIVVREKNYLAISKQLALNDDFLTLDHSHITKLSAFALPFVCRSAELRDKYLSQFSGAGIEIRPMIAGNIQKQPFYLKYSASNFDLPETDILHNQSFYCGNYADLTEADLEVIKSCLIKF